MNLCEFFECMDSETDVIVEWNGENIFSSKVCNISEDESVMYWIKSESIVLKDGVMIIPVEHQDEINKRIEANRKSAGLEDVTDRADNIKGRIRNLEAIVWTYEHHNQIMYMSDNAKDSMDFRKQLKEQFGFDENQAQAIMDMRNKSFTLQERERVQEELQRLLCKQKHLS